MARSTALTLVVDRPATEVFSVLSDLRNDPKWRREWRSARTETDGEPVVGSRVTLVGRSLGRPMEVLYEVTALDPGRTASWAARSGPLPLRFSRTVEEVDGGARITFTYAMTGRLTGLLWPLLAPIGRRQLVGDLPALRRLLGAAAQTDRS